MAASILRISNPNTENMRTITENGWKKVWHHPLSTFSIDVDAASYSKVRRFLVHGTNASKDAVTE